MTRRATRSLAGHRGRLLNRPSNQASVQPADAVARCVKEKALSNIGFVNGAICKARHASIRRRSAAIVGLLALVATPQIAQASGQFSPRLEDTIQKVSASTVCRHPSCVPLRPLRAEATRALAREAISEFISLAIACFANTAAAATFLT